MAFISSVDPYLAFINSNYPIRARQTYPKITVPFFGSTFFLRATDINRRKKGKGEKLLLLWLSVGAPLTFNCVHLLGFVVFVEEFFILVTKRNSSLTQLTKSNAQVWQQKLMNLLNCSRQLDNLQTSPQFQNVELLIYTSSIKKLVTPFFINQTDYQHIIFFRLRYMQLAIACASN